MGSDNIHAYWLTCKTGAGDLLRDWGLMTAVILLGLASFGLGRLSAIESVRPPITITEAPALAAPRGMFMGGEVVASKSGSVYYYPWCSAGSSIVPASQIWFK